MLDANPSLTVDQVKQILFETAHDWGPEGQDIDYGHGRLDGYQAVAQAANQPGNGGPEVPTHQAFAGSVISGQTAEHLVTVTSATYPLNVTLLMPGSGTAPDLDLYVIGPNGNQVGRSAGTSRQEQVALTVNQTGTYRIQVRSYSGAGVYTVDVSAGIGTTNDAPPTASIINPVNGATVSGVVEVQIAADDDLQVAQVAIAVDDNTYQDVTGSFDGTYYRYTWDTTGTADGPHTLTARVRDSGGQEAEATATVTVANQGGPGQPTWSRSGSVSPSSRNAQYGLTVLEPGYVDFTLSWGSTADLDLYVYAPDGSLAGRAFTLNNPERIRVDTSRWGTGTYQVRVNLYSGAASNFTLSAVGYAGLIHTGTVTPASRNVTHVQNIAAAGQNRVLLTWPTTADLDFFIYDPTGRERARAYTLNNPEVREFMADLTGDWSVRVNLYGGTATSYTLQWYAPAPVLQ